MIDFKTIKTGQKIKVELNPEHHWRRSAHRDSKLKMILEQPFLAHVEGICEAGEGSPYTAIGLTIPGIPEDDVYIAITDEWNDHRFCGVILEVIDEGGEEHDW